MSVDVNNNIFKVSPSLGPSSLYILSRHHRKTRRPPRHHHHLYHQRLPLQQIAHHHLRHDVTIIFAIIFLYRREGSSIASMDFKRDDHVLS